MAIVQISRITNRKGNSENLPQLAGAELGWCIDTRRLFIGNGTLQEGAPVIGNTEVLTEYSDITALLDYTYEDAAVGYVVQTGPTASQPVVRSVQAKLDDYADVRDFGAVGDGTTDDTAAINRALNQLYCRETNVQIRRSLFFPAGKYRVTSTIMIPTYAKLDGEGPDSSIIWLDIDPDDSTVSPYVARTADSKQQTGANIGTNGATPPINIQISDMGFMTSQTTDIFLVDSAEEISFNNVSFTGPLTVSDIENANVVPLPDIAAVKFNSTTSLVTRCIQFEQCFFTLITRAFSNSATVESVSIGSSNFEYLYQGVVLNTGAATGFRVVNNLFDYIFAEAVAFDNVNRCLTAFNAFYNVGNSIGSPTAVTPCISFANDSCVSVNDMFARPDAQAFETPRVRITGTNATSGATESQLGRFHQNAGRAITLNNNASNQTIEIFNVENVRALTMNYTITRDTYTRTGTLMIASGPDDGSRSPAWSDDYVEDASTGVTLSVSQTGAALSVRYSTTNTGLPGVFNYSTTYLA